jgi:MOSC domain-containing protein YiiM
MTTATVLSIQIGRPKLYGIPSSVLPLDKPYTTGFVKNPIEQPIRLDWTNLDGDAQADLENHGGRDKAVCAYAAEHYPAWRTELNKSADEFAHGAFGENLTIAGYNESTICLGDQFQLGTARIEVSQPRQPCWKLGRRWQLKELPGLVIDSGRTGWYFRVLMPGQIAAGDELQLLARPCPEWTIARANHVFYELKKDADASQALSQVAPLAVSWRDALESRANLLRSR